MDENKRKKEKIFDLYVDQCHVFDVPRTEPSRHVCKENPGRWSEDPGCLGQEEPLVMRTRTLNAQTHTKPTL